VRTLLVGNPTAQSGKNADRITGARALLDEAGVPHDFLPTAPAGGTVGDLAAALSANPEIGVVIYMGGDGTFAEVAKGILAAGRGRDVRMGMLPTGTANDQGKSFGLESDETEIERNVRVLVEALREGLEVRLDAGHIRGLDHDGKVLREDHFFDSAGWGISPRVLSLRNEDRKVIEGIPLVREVWRDQLVYAGALLRTFVESYVEDDKFDVDAVADGQRRRWEGLTDLIVKGTRVYGGLWVFAPDALPDDGKFEVEPFVGKRDWISKAIVALDGSGATEQALGALGVHHSEGFSASRIELELHEHAGGLPISAQIDGEEWLSTPRVVIDVLPRALRLLVPREHARP
jgi:diacylglycerol kinase family enzyme